MEAGTLVRIFLYFTPNNPPTVRLGVIIGPSKDIEESVDGHYLEDVNPNYFTILTDPKHFVDYKGRTIIEVLS